MAWNQPGGGDKDPWKNGDNQGKDVEDFLNRLKSGMTSLHNRFRGCIRDTRAEMAKAFSDELMALEVYVTWRGTGLSIETPAVRQ